MTDLTCHTAEQSSDLKVALKDHWKMHGVGTSLPPDLAARAEANPNEYGEAAFEFDTYGWDYPFPMPA
jgi:hypothetical protein